MTFRTLLVSIFGALCLSANAQTQEPVKEPTIYELAPFERAVCCIKYYEGIHRKKDYPYYLKTNIIQRFTEEFIEDDDVEAITNGVPYDNNEGVRPYKNILQIWI